VADSTNGDSQLRPPASRERVDQPGGDPVWMSPAFIDAIARRVLQLG